MKDINNQPFQPVIKWSGSKRKIAYEIKTLIPKNSARYFEPFVGGGSMLYVVDNNKKIASDINKPLIDLWNLIKNNPDYLLETYTNYWNQLNDDTNEESYKVYNEIRTKFNTNFQPEDLFFLSRTCVNGLIRFNKKGEFNNSLHYSRKGIAPHRLDKVLKEWTDKIQNTEFIHMDYKDTLNILQKDDFVYLDPPYFNTKGMYYGSIDNEAFLTYLEELNIKGIKFLLSFDGKTCAKDYTFEIPKELYKRHKYIHSGQSTFKKVIDKKLNKVYESMYLNY